MIGLLYPNGFIVPVGTQTAALRLGQHSALQTVLVRRQGNRWLLDESLPVPTPRRHATADNPERVYTKEPRRKGKGRSKGRQRADEAELVNVGSAP